MDEIIYPYDKTLYDRRFMNCGQRHAVVMLAERGLPVNLLFNRAWISTDQVFQQVIVGKRPKFAFESDFFGDADLQAIGAQLVVHEADRLDDVRATMNEAISRDGFALLSGDVFYFPHCPEYRTSHAPHIVIVRGQLENGLWDVVDDNAISVLCQYQYTDSMVRDFFENNIDRKLRTVAWTPGLAPEAAKAQAWRQFAESGTQHQDSLHFYGDVGSFLDDRFDTLPTKLKSLHDAFALISGARFCLAQYLEENGVPTTLVTQFRDVANQAFVLKSLVVKAQVTGRLAKPRMVEYCLALGQAEKEATAQLLSFLSHCAGEKQPPEQTNA